MRNINYIWKNEKYKLHIDLKNKSSISINYMLISIFNIYIIIYGKSIYANLLDLFFRKSFVFLFSLIYIKG